MKENETKREKDRGRETIKENRTSRNVKSISNTMITLRRRHCLRMNQENVNEQTRAACSGVVLGIKYSRKIEARYS